MTVDMSKFIAAKSDQLNADDLIDGPRTVTITKVTAAPDAAEQPVSIHYEGDNGKPFKPCKTMRRILVGVWGKDASKYVGRSMTLYRDPTVAFGGLQVGGIRISHMSDIAEDKTVALLVTRGRKAPFKIKPLLKQETPATDDDEQTVALKALTEAAANGTEALANVWKQKWLAPHRDALQLDLDRLKAIAAETDQKSAAGNAPASEATAQSLEEAASTASGETTSSSGPTATTDASPSEPHPDQQAKCDEIIAEINAAGAIFDVNSIVSRNNLDIAAMPDELAVKIEIAADKRKNAIKAEREKTPAQGELAQ